MAPRSRPVDELSAGGVVYRAAAGGAEVVLIRVGTRWSLPKGWVEAGEKPADAALREIEEEVGLPRAGLRVDAVVLPPSEYTYRRRETGRLVDKRVEHLLVAWVGDDTPLEPQPGEVDEARWVDLDEAMRLVSFRDLRRVLEAARRHLAAGGGAPGAA